MTFSTWDLLINVAAMFFWFRLWMPEERDLYFNPHLSSLWRFSEQVIGALRAVFFKTPDRLVALALLLFLLVFRGITFYGLALPTHFVWLLRLGFETPPPYAAPGVLSFLALSFLSFAIFLFTFWCIALLYAGRRTSPFNHASETLYNLARPFSLVGTELRPLVLLAFGLLLAFVLNLDISRPVLSENLTVPNLVRYSLSALQGWVEALNVIRMFMLVLIIGSWASMFSSSPALMFFCKDWIDLLLGPLRRYPLRIGMFDLTPIVFFFALQGIQWFLAEMLQMSYGGLP